MCPMPLESSSMSGLPEEILQYVNDHPKPDAHENASFVRGLVEGKQGNRSRDIALRRFKSDDFDLHAWCIFPCDGVDEGRFKIEAALDMLLCFK